MKRILILLLVASLVALSGCTVEAKHEPPEQSEDSNIVTKDDITKLEFEEDRVVCYVYREDKDTNEIGVGGTGGMSCFTMEELNGY